MCQLLAYKLDIKLKILNANITPAAIYKCEHVAKLEAAHYCSHKVAGSLHCGIGFPVTWICKLTHQIRKMEIIIIRDISPMNISQFL